jgi:hypothetical protein
MPAIRRVLRQIDRRTISAAGFGGVSGVRVIPKL